MMMTCRLRLPLLLSAALLFLSFPLSLHAGKRITIISPDALARQYQNETSLPLKPALFGPNLFGKTILGTASYYVDPANPDGCNALNASMTVPAGGWVSNEDSPMIPQILLINRGTCNFVKKVYNAQNIGAAAVIIVAKQGEPLPYMADDGTGSNIAIPAMIILYTDGMAIQQVLNTGQAVLLQLTWSPDEVVEVDFWTSSNDAASTALKESFGDVVASFGASMNFTPHYQIYDFYSQCSRFPTECSKLCLGSGRYCALDPERDYTRGLDGFDVVRENLYGGCVGTYSKSVNNVALWFHYVNQFRNQCVLNNATCRTAVLQQVGLPVTQIQSCYTNSWVPAGNEAGNNTILSQYVADQSTFGVYTLPFLTINLVPFRDSISCSSYTINNCKLVDTICAGYATGTQPALCLPSSDSSGNSVDNGSGGGSGGVSGATVAAIVIPIVAVVLVGVVLFVRRQRVQLRGEIDSIIQQYLPLSDAEQQQSAEASKQRTDRTEHSSDRLIDSAEVGEQA